MFKIAYPDAAIVKYEFYLKYFHENFNYRFGRPQVDTCIRCEELSVKLKSASLEAAKRVAAAEQIIHKRRSKKFYSKINEITALCQDNKNEDCVGLSFDFMQNLPLPHIPVQDVFYLRQLWLHCFGIHNMSTGKSKIYLYHEGVANKGANDVCSMLLKYINTSIPHSVKKLYLFSDGCPGQNKNTTVVRFLCSLIQISRFNKIEHYFPIRGHSYLPNDRNFGTIKRKLKLHDRIYVPDQYKELIKASSSKFEVEMVQSEDILDFDNWWPSFYKKKCLSIDSYGTNIPKEQKITFCVSQYMSFSYERSAEGTVVTQEYINGMTSHKFRLVKPNTSTIELPHAKAYPAGKTPIKKKKLEDLQKLHPFIGDAHKNFWEAIDQWPADDNGDEEIESEIY